MDLNVRERNTAFYPLQGIWTIEFRNFTLSKLRDEKQSVLACVALSDVCWICFQSESQGQEDLERNECKICSLSAVPPPQIWIYRN